MIPAIDEILIQTGRTKSITTARESILKLVKLQSLVANGNVVKCGKYSHANFANFVYFCITCRNLHHFWAESGANFCKQYKSIQNLLNLKCYIFRILQHFATKLSNFRMLFLAVVMDFVLFAQIKISSIAGIIHWPRYIQFNDWPYIKVESKMAEIDRPSQSPSRRLKQFVNLFPK